MGFTPRLTIEDESVLGGRVVYDMGTSARWPLFLDGKHVAWVRRSSNEVAIEYADLGLLHEGSSKQILLERVTLQLHEDDEHPVVAHNVEVDFCTLWLEFTSPHRLRTDTRDAGMVAYQLGGGPPLNKVPLQGIEQYDRWWPIPDPEDADEASSRRMFSQRSPAAMSVLLRKHMLDEEPTPQQLENFAEGLKSNARRGYTAFRHTKPLVDPEELPHYTEAHGAPLSEFQPFMPPVDGAEHVIGQGYREGGGGWSKLFGSERPEHVDWERSGLATGHALHMTIDSFAFGAVFFGSYTAAMLATHHFNAVASFLWNGDAESWASRGFGNLMQCGADMAAVSVYFPDLRVHEVIERAIDVLESRNIGFMPAPDNGETIEGGHLTFDEVKAAYGDFLRGVLAAHVEPDKVDDAVDAACKDIATSDAAFYVGILVSGLLRLRDLWDKYRFWDKHPSGPSAGQELRRRISAQAKLGAVFLFECTKPQYDVHMGLQAGARRIPKTGCWEDVGLLHHAAEGGDDDNDAKGVGIRFVVPAMFRASEAFGNPVLAERALTMLKICNRDRWWNGPDFTRAMLECLWPLGKQFGWEGVRQILP